MNSKNNKLILRKIYLPKLEKLGDVRNHFSLTEKTIFWILIVILVVSAFSMVQKINNIFLVEVPTKGGELTEGVVGSPRFINPLLAISNADRDLTALVYSGLLKAMPNGKLIPDLAKEYIISEDGLTYTFTLKEGITFHDGTPITAKDVAFTIDKSLDNTIKSPKRANWEGVAVNILNDKQIEFVLKTPYSPFPENTTLGILPKHIWDKIESEQFAFSQFNIEPIGSGPYKISKTKRNSSGIMERYKLKSFKNYALGEPYISEIIIKFYPNEESVVEAYNKNSIESIGAISPEKAREIENRNSRVESIPLPRIFGIFFNQNENSILTEIAVRKALNRSVDREKIVSKVLSGYGTPIYGPVPKNSQYYDENIEISFNPESAKEILEENGWKINEESGIREKTKNKVSVPLEITISTSNAPELKNVANLIKEDWEKIGARVNIKIFETGDLNQNIIRPREYEALLFGEIIGRDMDLFAFWHSSQRNDPGLNIALYTNITSDKLLEQARTIRNPSERRDKFFEFQEEILSDIPAVFLYSPDFIYIIPEKIKGFALGQMILPSERFLDVHKWFINTETIWKIFTN